MKNIKKSSLLLGVFSVGIGLLTAIVAAYSYVGDQPLNNALTATGLMLLSVVISIGNVTLTKRQQWKRWTAYATVAVFLVVAAVGAVVSWEYLPFLPGGRWWFNVSVSVAFASLMVSLYAAHFVFDDGELERSIRMAIPDFRFVPEGRVMNSSVWNADQEFLLECLPHERPIQAFIGAGESVVEILSAIMCELIKRHKFQSLSFDPEQGTQRLSSGKLVHKCVAQSSTNTTVFTFVLDPKRGEGIVVQSVPA